MIEEIIPLELRQFGTVVFIALLLCMIFEQVCMAKLREEIPTLLPPLFTWMFYGYAAFITVGACRILYLGVTLP